MQKSINSQVTYYDDHTITLGYSSSQCMSKTALARAVEALACDIVILHKWHDSYKRFHWVLVTWAQKGKAHI